MSGLSVTDPIDFESLIISPNVLPGDVVEMLGGTYKGNWIVGIGGNKDAPVVFKAYKGEKVAIEGGITVQKEYTEWQGVSIHQPAKDRTAVYMTRIGTRLTDCDISGGFLGVEWYGSGVGSLVRCNIHDTGSYGIYTHNNSGGLREITDCTFSNIGGAYDLHMYSEAANAIRDYSVTGCAFGKMVVVHGREVTNCNFLNNKFGAGLHLGNGLTKEDPREFVVTSNSFLATLRAWTCSKLEIRDNAFTAKTNVELVRGLNEKSLLIDKDQYNGGDFSLDGKVLAWKEWQAAGFDANGTYT